MLEPIALSSFWAAALMAVAAVLMAVFGWRWWSRAQRGTRLRHQAFVDDDPGGSDSRFARERQAWVEAEAQLKQVLAAQGRTPSNRRA